MQSLSSISRMNHAAHFKRLAFHYSSSQNRGPAAGKNGHRVRNDGDASAFSFDRIHLRPEGGAEDFHRDSCTDNWFLSLAGSIHQHQANGEGFSSSVLFFIQYREAHAALRLT